MSYVRALALTALMVVGLAAVSEAQSPSTPPSRPDSGFYRRGPRAQGEFGPRGRRGFGGMKFARDLNLTDAQKNQIKAINEKYQPQHRALHDRAKPFTDAARAARQKGDTAAFRSNMEKARQVLAGGESIRTQEQAEIRAILTPEQRTKYDARQKERAERRAKVGAEGQPRGWGRKGRRGPPAPVAK